MPLNLECNFAGPSFVVDPMRIIMPPQEALLTSPLNRRGEQLCVFPAADLFPSNAPVNLRADLSFSFYFNGFESEPNRGDLLENVLGVGHTSLCAMRCILFLVLTANNCFILRTVLNT